MDKHLFKKWRKTLEMILGSAQVEIFGAFMSSTITFHKFSLQTCLMWTSFVVVKIHVYMLRMKIK